MKFRYRTFALLFLAHQRKAAGTRKLNKERPQWVRRWKWTCFVYGLEGDPHFPVGEQWISAGIGILFIIIIIIALRVFLCRPMQFRCISCTFSGGCCCGIERDVVFRTELWRRYWHASMAVYGEKGSVVFCVNSLLDRRRSCVFSCL